MMILMKRKKILLFLIPFGIFFILSFAYLNLDKYVEAEIFKFAEENEKFESGIYNLTKENTTVKEVAQICKKINPKI